MSNEQGDNFSETCHVVLGATGGIGSELCRRLRARGATVFAAARDQEKLQRLAGAHGVRPVRLDATDIEQVASCVQDASEQAGRLDGIANCVGSLLLKPAHRTSRDEWQQTLETNLTTAFAAVSAGAQTMTQRGGSIVLVSSVAARIGLPNHEAIAAAKAGVLGLTLAAAATYAGRRIRVNCVAPGLVRTPLTSRLTATAAAEQASTAMHPIGRLGEPADVADAILWLLDPSRGWVTGQILGIDGGMSTLRLPTRQ